MQNYYTKNFKYFAMASGAVVVIALAVGIILGGMNIGIDFAGGTIMTIEMGGDFDVAHVNAVLNNHGLTDAPVVKSGTNPAVQTQAVVRMKAFADDVTENATRQEIVTELKAKYPQAEQVGIDRVGAVASVTLIQNALWAILIAGVLMLLYIWIRFELYNGLVAIVALLHDVLIMLAFVTIFRIQINSSFIAAVLTIIGYSINNTIVVFDRVRENSKKLQGYAREQIVNISVRETLTRSLYTSLTTLFTITALYFFGVDAIQEFTLPIIIGLVAGTYSSVLLAAPLWYYWHLAADRAGKAKAQKPKKR